MLNSCAGRWRVLKVHADAIHRTSIHPSIKIAAESETKEASLARLEDATMRMSRTLCCSPQQQHCHHHHPSTSTCSSCSYGPHRRLLRHAGPHVYSQRRRNKVTALSQVHHHHHHHPVLHVAVAALLFVVWCCGVVPPVHSFQPGRISARGVHTKFSQHHSSSLLLLLLLLPKDEVQEEKPRLHPVLIDLCLANTKQQHDGANEQGGGGVVGVVPTITATDVLQQLLATHGVTEEAVRAAYQTAEQSNRKTRDNSDLPAKIQEAAPAPIPAYRTRHIALRVYYDGQKYTGLAEHIGHAADQSVEKEVFQALRKAKLIDSNSRAVSDYSRGGRTDKGVSAVGQVMAWQLKSAFHEQASWDEEGTKLIETKDLVRNSRDTHTVWAPQRKHQDDCTGTIVRQQKELSEYAFDQILNHFLPDDIRILGKSSPMSNPVQSTLVPEHQQHEPTHPKAPFQSTNIVSLSLSLSDSLVSRLGGVFRTLFLRGTNVPILFRPTGDEFGKDPPRLAAHGGKSRLSQLLQNEH
jgi:hypothetical protein